MYVLYGRAKTKYKYHGNFRFVGATNKIFSIEFKHVRQCVCARVPLCVSDQMLCEAYLILKQINQIKYSPLDNFIARTNGK